MEKQYVWIIKEKESQYWPFLSIWFSKDDLDKMYKELNNWWVNLTVSKRKEVSDKWVTHSAFIYKPDTKPQSKPTVKDDLTIDDIPF